MDFVGHGLDALGPRRGVGYQSAVGVARLFGPAIVNVDVLVSEIFEAQLDKGIRRIESGRSRSGLALRNILPTVLVLHRLVERQHRFPAIGTSDTYPAIPTESRCFLETVSQALGE